MSSQDIRNEEPLQFPLPYNRRFHKLLALSGVLLFIVGIVFVRMEHILTAEGYVFRKGEVRLHAPESGVVLDLGVIEGDRLEPGDPILSLDSRAVDERIHAARREMVGLSREETRLQEQFDLLAMDPSLMELSTAADRVENLLRIVQVREEILERMVGFADTQAVSALVIDREKTGLLEARNDLIHAEHLKGIWEAGYLDRRRASLLAQMKVIELERESVAEEIRLLEERRDRLSVFSPEEGELTYLGVFDEGVFVEEGSLLAKVSREGAPFQVRAFLGERNIDLIRPGTQARIRSMVFDSMLEGFAEGRVVRLHREPSLRERSPDAVPLYELIIEVESSPHPLVLGSSVEAELILGRRSVLQMLLRLSPNRREQFDQLPELYPVNEDGHE